MANITKTFTYPVPDDQYAQTNNDNKTATLTYNGPAEKFILIDKETNKLTNRVISEEMFNADFNNQNEDCYAIRVDCNENTLVCALLSAGGGIDPEQVPSITEEVPGCDFPYVRNDPILPDHAYDVANIEYDPNTGEFLKPFPWHPPIEEWEDIISLRNNLLRNADRTLSEDLPESVYTKVSNYKKYLRDLPETFGVAWTVEIASAGTGYTVGDQILINDPRFKNNTTAPDILMEVTEIGSSGEIVKMTKRSPSYCHNYHPDAGSYSNVFFVPNASGTGATFNLSKVKTVMAHKITVLRNPVEQNDLNDSHSEAATYGG
jgi:hypothetical protein